MKKLLTLLSTITFLAAGKSFSQHTFPVNGINDERHLHYAFRNAKIFIDYKTSVDSATLLIRDGKIIDVGKNIKIPAGTVVYDLQGKYIYPSFIDLISDYGISAEKKQEERESRRRGPQFESNTKGAYGWNQAIRPETDAVTLFKADEKKSEELRNTGFGAVLTHSRDGISRGSGVFVSSGNGNESESIVVVYSVE